MKSLISLARRAPKATSAFILMLAAAIIVPAALFAWGPSRDTYTIAVPADHVTFNSITDNPSQGDERNFVQVRESTASNTTYADSISLTAGKEYVVFIYFHNNASSSLNESGVGIANGAYAKAAIPATVKKGSTSTAVGYVGASNATPAEVWDNIDFNNNTNGDIALRYVPGSTTIHSFGAVNGATMSDSIVTTGAPIGYESLNGVVPGCNEFAGYITLRVKADQPDFTLTKQVRISGTTDWKETVAVKTGDSVDYLITYKNTGTTVQNDVVISDTLPAGVTYKAGTTYVVNSTNPSGVKVSDKIVSGGINISDYAPGAAAYVKFSAIITAKSDSLPTCGTNTLINNAKVETNNGSKEDTANVTLEKECTDTPPELPHTGPAADILSIVGLGTLVTTLGYYVASRRSIIGR